MRQAIFEGDARLFATPLFLTEARSLLLGEPSPLLRAPLGGLLFRALALFFRLDQSESFRFFPLTLERPPSRCLFENDAPLLGDQALMLLLDAPTLLADALVF